MINACTVLSLAVWLCGAVATSAAINARNLCNRIDGITMSIELGESHHSRVELKEFMQIFSEETIPSKLPLVQSRYGTFVTKDGIFFSWYLEDDTLEIFSAEPPVRAICEVVSLLPLKGPAERPLELDVVTNSVANILYFTNSPKSPNSVRIKPSALQDALREASFVGFQTNRLFTPIVLSNVYASGHFVDVNRRFFYWQLDPGVLTLKHERFDYTFKIASTNVAVMTLHNHARRQSNRPQRSSSEASPYE